VVVTSANVFLPCSHPPKLIPNPLNPQLTPRAFYRIEVGGVIWVLVIAVKSVDLRRQRVE